RSDANRKRRVGPRSEVSEVEGGIEKERPTPRRSRDPSWSARWSRRALRNLEQFQSEPAGKRAARVSNPGSRDEDIRLDPRRLERELQRLRGSRDPEHPGPGDEVSAAARNRERKSETALDRRRGDSARQDFPHRRRPGGSRAFLTSRKC